MHGVAFVVIRSATRFLNFKFFLHALVLLPPTKLSVYVDSDAVRLYLAGKACGWHAGVLLAAPTVVHAEV
jgi:hypothetical protein